MKSTFNVSKNSLESGRIKSAAPVGLVAIVFLFLAGILSNATAADYTYTTSNGEAKITSYTGPGGAVTVPDTIEGKPVTSIGDLAFQDATAVTSVSVPDSVRTIGIYAFTGCTSLSSATFGNGLTTMGNYIFTGCAGLRSVTIGGGITSIGLLAFSDCTLLGSIYFEGNAPSLGDLAFQNASLVTIYRLPDATGWGSSFGGRPTMIWDPMIVTDDSEFGFDEEGGFGFNISAAIDLTAVVQSSDDFTGAIWTDLGTVTLEDGIVFFLDPNATESSIRFYRLRMPR